MACSFRPLAEADLEEIADFTASRNPGHAVSFIRELRQRCERSAQMPRAAPLRPELGEGVRVVAFRRRYLICYAEHEGEVVIERIVHGARNIADLFRTRGQRGRGGDG